MHAKLFICGFLIYSTILTAINSGMYMKIEFTIKTRFGYQFIEELDFPRDNDESKLQSGEIFSNEFHL